MQAIIEMVQASYRSSRRITIGGSALYGGVIGIKWAKDDHEERLTDYAFYAISMSVFLSAVARQLFFLFETALRGFKPLGKFLLSDISGNNQGRR